MTEETSVPDDAEADDALTITPQAYRTLVIRRSLESQANKFVLAGDYVAATLDAEFRGREVFLEGEAVVEVIVFDRHTGLRTGEAKVRVPITFAPEHRRNG